MKKITLLATLISLLAISCVDEEDCYKCELISKDSRFSTTEYLTCDTDLEHYKQWVYDRGKVGTINCTEL